MWQVPAGGGRKTSSCSSQPKSKELEFRDIGVYGDITLIMDNEMEN